ncbi:DNA-binding transcriptional regulator [uncultured Eubacterium sp.]|uniref:helix-turn-helix domain-containing protein n=1 Tax=uncultured Eubacterium sp. TaxID=165185 RepID=UPI00263342A9|nr:hypothetical protein [uncultured Eubacterium sp.]
MTVKTVAEYGTRLARMLAYYTQKDIDYKVYENKSGVLCVTVFFNNKEEERLAQIHETDLLILDKANSTARYDNIKDLRAATKMTQQGFGDYFGIPLRTIQQWEYEKRPIKPYIINLMQYKLTQNGVIK